MSDISAVKKSLKIKTGAVKRTLKEVGMYKDEVVAQKLKLDKLIADGAEEWDIKNGKKMLAESEKMVEDSQTRLGKSTGDLRLLVIGAKTEAALAEDKDFLEAEAALENANL